MQIGVPRETTPGERRVALVPDTVARLLKSGVSVAIEAGAGSAAYHADDAYRTTGATIARDAAELYARSDVVLKIHRPSSDAPVDEVAMLREGSVLIALLYPLIHLDLVRRLADRRITAFALDAIPRISRAQPLDALSAMSTVTGYHAVLSAAAALPKFFPLLMTAAGTLTPARVLILGAGVAGLQAIATARRLGAVVEAFDARAVVKEQVQSLGATFVEVGAESAEGAGGYAAAQSEDAQKRTLEVLALRSREADVIITTALVPGMRAPRLITAEMVKGMRPGSVIVDLAGEQGGNCELSEPGTTVVRHEVTIMAPLNGASAIPVHASQMYSRNVSSFLQLLVKDGALALNFEDEIVRDSCVTHEGRIVHARARAAVEGATAGAS